MKPLFEIIIEASLAFVFLGIPMYSAVAMDWNGDKHPNKDNYVITIIGLVVSALWALLMRTAYDYDFYLMWFCCGLVSAAIYMFIFPYVINYVLIKRGIMNRPYWYDALNDVSWPDNWQWWRRLNWRYRMAVSALLFIFMCVPYFKLIV